MEVLDIGLERPAILPPTIVTMMVFLMMKVLECLQVMEDMDIGLLRKATLPIATTDLIIVVIKVVTMVEVDIGLNISAIITIAILEQ